MKQAHSSLVRFSNAEQATKGSICGLARWGLESAHIRDQHGNECEWCASEPDVLFAAAEEFLKRPESVLDVESIDVKDATQKQSEKSKSWGF